MIVDTSALIAIIRQEPEAEALVAAIVGAPSPQMSAASSILRPRSWSMRAGTRP